MLVDSHCHLQLRPLYENLEHVLARASRAGVTAYMVPATTRKDWPMLASLSAANPGAIRYTLGLHPCFMQAHGDEDLLELARLKPSDWAGLAGIGETGLDGRDRATLPEQIALFRVHCDLASRIGLPLIIHAVRCHGHVLSILREYPKARGVIHAFSGSPEVAQQYVDLGFYLGIGSVILRDSAQRTRQAIAVVPSSSLLLETDAPDMPAPHQPWPNEPCYLARVRDRLAELLCTDAEHVAKQTGRNAERLFGAW